MANDDGRTESDEASEHPLGEFIRRQRELSEMSMRQFADVVGISNPYLSQIERGQREPSRRVVDAIARSLQMSADALYSQAGIDPEPKRKSPSVRAALEADPDLTPRQRRAVLEIYESLRDSNRRRGEE